MTTLKHIHARRHADLCGLLEMTGTDAVPISGNAHDNPVSVFLAQPVTNPEDMSIIYPACMLLTASMMANLAVQYGLDYVVVFSE